MSKRGATCIGVIAACLTGLTAPAASAEQQVLVPVTPWNLDATPHGCTLRRGFGNEERPVILEIARVAPGDFFDLLASGDELAELSRSSSITVAFGDLPDGGSRKAIAIKSVRPAAEPAPGFKIASMSLDNTAKRPMSMTVRPETEAAVATITFSQGDDSVVLQTGSLGAPFAGMRQCTDELLKVWGLDPTVQNALSRQAEAKDLNAWAEAMVEKQFNWIRMSHTSPGPLTLTLRILLDANGKPTDCDPLASDAPKVLEAQACGYVLRHVEFTPALDSEGNSVPSYYISSVNLFSNLIKR